MSEPFDDEDATPRAASGKRPAPPPKSAAKPVRAGTGGKAADAPVVPAVQPGEPRLAWGHVGSVTKPGRLSDGTSRPGVIRVVEANISYSAPPLDPFVWVSASLNYVGQYEMFWAEGNPADARSLADVGAELRSGRPARPRLAVLDNAADALLATAQRLHSDDCRMGLVEPGNVLLVPGSDGRRLVLPDLGFTWRGSHGKFPWKDSPGRPRWLGEDPRENPSATLWDEEPVRQQFSTSTDDHGDHDLVPITSDLRTLARVFAAVLTGRIERDISAPNAAPTWGVLGAALKGEYASAEQFRAALAEHPLSEHWLAPKAPTANKGSGSAMALLGCLGLVAALAAGGAGLYFAGVFDPKPDETSVAAGPTAKNGSTNSKPPDKTASKPPDKPKHPLDKVEVDWKRAPLSRPSELENLLKQIEAAKDPKQKRDLLIQMYQLYETSDETTRAKIRPWTEYVRGQYVDGWEKRYRDADETAIKNVGLRYDAGQQIYDLNQELSALRQQYEPISPSLNGRENECLLISDLRSRELGSSR